MKHIDEHTLMQFVLHPADFGERRLEVENHLRECHGCRALAEEMVEFYRNAGEFLASLEKAGGKEDSSIVSLSNSPATRRRFDAVPQPLTRVDRFRGFVRRRPVLASAGVTVVLGMIALAAQITVTSLRSHPQPSYIVHNEKASLLEVFGTDQRQLFALPVEKVAEIWVHEQRWRVPMSLIDDIRETGENLLVTGVPLTDDPGHRVNMLRIYDGAKKLLVEKELGSPVTFRGNPYTIYFGINGMRSEPVRGGRGKELLVSGVDARSPSCVYRLDGAGNILGEFWHFGHVGGLYCVDLQRDGRRQIIMCGMNDVDDGTNGSFPAILVLDPSKLSGKTESAGSKGFGYPSNEGELYYIKVDPTEKERRTGLKSGFISMRMDQDSSLTFAYAGGEIPTIGVFFLNFSRDMELRSIWVDDGMFHTIFKNDRVAVEASIAELKSGIRYWDGLRWTVQKTTILHHN